MKKHIIIGTLFALVLLASVARASETVERTDLADIFQGFDGTFIMYDEGADRYTVFNKTLSETRLPPCSTFKVFHALIGLDSGVLDRDDARTLMKWNGKPSSIAAWNHDQTLASAMRHSVVWYFQRVATGIGEERMQRGLDRIGYGNRDISGGLTRFWLQSSLKISPREQVGLLRALFNGSLPFAAEDIAVVKRDITLSSGKGLRFMGKTGSGVGRRRQGHHRLVRRRRGNPAQPLVIRREHPRAGRLRRAGPGHRRSGARTAQHPALASLPHRKAVAPPPLKSYNSSRQFTRSPFPCHTREW